MLLCFCVCVSVCVCLQDHDRYVGKRGLWRQIQQRRFQLYNREYMAFLATSSVGSSGYGAGGMRGLDMVRVCACAPM